MIAFSATSANGEHAGGTSSKIRHGGTEIGIIPLGALTEGHRAEARNGGIDRIVYRLYGLSDEEGAVVEDG